MHISQWINGSLLNQQRTNSTSKSVAEIRSSLCSFSFRPGTYEADKLPHKKITWPMKFGSPDWSLVPVPERRTLRTEVGNLYTGIQIVILYTWDLVDQGIRQRQSYGYIEGLMPFFVCSMLYIQKERKIARNARGLEAMGRKHDC